MLSHYANESSRNKYFTDPQWELEAKEFPIFLFKKKDLLLELDQIHESKVCSDTLKCNYENLDVEKRHVLFDNKEKADTIKYLSNDIAFTGEYSLKLSPENPYSTAIKINDLKKVSYLEISVWYYSNQSQSNIVASNGRNFNFFSREGDLSDPLGWKRIVLGFWISKNIEDTGILISLWNSGDQPSYFDDLQIVKKYKN